MNTLLNFDNFIFLSLIAYRIDQVTQFYAEIKRGNEKKENDY